MASSNDYVEFLTFRRMITPLIIQVVFWIGTVIAVLAALAQIITGIANDSFAAVLMGLATLILGPLLVRIYCELLIVLFQIHSELTAIRRNTAPAERGFEVAPSETGTTV